MTFQIAFFHTNPYYTFNAISRFYDTNRANCQSRGCKETNIFIRQEPMFIYCCLHLKIWDKYILSAPRSLPFHVIYFCIKFSPIIFFYVTAKSPVYFYVSYGTSDGSLHCLFIGIWGSFCSTTSISNHDWKTLQNCSFPLFYISVSFFMIMKYSIVSHHKCYLSSAQNLISEWNFKASVLNFFSFTNSLKKVFL